MTPENFVYWLDGYLKRSNLMLDADNVEEIQEKIDYLLNQDKLKHTSFISIGSPREMSQQLVVPPMCSTL